MAGHSKWCVYVRRHMWDVWERRHGSWRERGQICVYCQVKWWYMSSNGVMMRNVVLHKTKSECFMERKVERRCWCWCRWIYWNMKWWRYCGIWNGGDEVEYEMVEILWIMECWRYCWIWNGGDIVEYGMVDMLLNMKWWRYSGVWNGGDIVEHGMVDNIHWILWNMEWWRYCWIWNGEDIVDYGMVEILWNME